MSRAHPIGLRIVSKELNPSFIGVGQYYSYNQLKYNIVISKSIQQLSKQLAVPAYQVTDRFNSEKKSTKNLVLYSNMLPMSVRLKAKQLFDSQYALNRRRFYNAAIYTTRLLKQQFEKNYNGFTTKDTEKSFFSNSTKCNLSNRTVPLVSFNKYQKWKSAKLSFYSLCPSVTFAQAFFRAFQKPFSSLRGNNGTKEGLDNQNQELYTRTKVAKQLQQTKVQGFLAATKDSDPYLMLSYGAPFFKEGNSNTRQKLKEFCFLTKGTEIAYDCLSLSNRPPFVNTLDRLGPTHVFTLKKHKSTNDLANTKRLFHKNFFQYLGCSSKKEQSYINTFVCCPEEWPLPATFSPAIPFTDYIYWQKCLYSTIIKTKKKATLAIKKQEMRAHSKAKNRILTPNQQSSVYFSKNQESSWASRELRAKPAINRQTTKRLLLLNYLGQPDSANTALHYFRLKKISKPTVATPLPLAKEAGNKQKRLHINSVPINKGAVFTDLRAHKISYTFCPRLNAATLNLKSIKKLTKQIEHFRSDIKLLAPLGLLLNRSFSEPVGINCISAVDNRLGKTYGNPFLKNLLFRRTPDNFLKSNYMSTQKGLLRTKNALFFDFAYTKDSLTKLGLKKTNTLMQQLLESGHKTLWLRKLSSVRL